ncbi:MAG: hypothetical protein OCD01_06880 [Fibrobacterales bacterium]
MKILSLLLCVSFLLSACLFDESNLDASQGYLEAQGVELTNDTVSVTLSNLTPDSLTLHKSNRTLFDASVNIVGSESTIGDFSAGFGYELTGITENKSVEGLDSLFFIQPYLVFDVDTLYSSYAKQYGAPLFQNDSVEIRYSVILHKYAEDMKNNRQDSVAFFGNPYVTGSEDTLAQFFNDLMDPNDLGVATYRVIRKEIIDTISLSDPLGSQGGIVLDSLVLALYNAPIIVPLGEELRAQVIALKDSLLALSIVFTSVKPIDSTGVDTLGGKLVHLQVDYPKPTLCFSDSLMITHSIDRFYVNRVDTGSLTALGFNVNSSRSTRGLDSVSFKLNGDALLAQLEQSIGTISGQYVNHVVQRATLTFTTNDRVWSEFDQPFVLEAVSETFDMSSVGFSGFKVLERQFAGSALSSIVDTTETVSVDITESVKHIVNLGRVGAEPVTYLYPSKSVVDPSKKYLLWSSVENNTIETDDNRFNRFLKSIDFSALTFDLHIELIELGAI